MKEKPRLLALVQLPPPVHGASIMNNIVVNNLYLKSLYDIEVVQLRFAESIEDIGRIRMQKIWEVFKVASRFASIAIKKRPDIVYFTLSPVGGAFYRDLLFIGLIKLFGLKRVFHLHGKGVRQAAASRLNRIIYRWAFKNAFVIHLSQLLYEDIQEFVDSSRCFFLPNGIPVTEGIQEKDDNQSGPVRFLFLSNMVREKGPIVFLNALVTLKNMGVEFEATFAGAVHIRECKEEFDRIVHVYGLKDHVRFVGPKYGLEKERLLVNSDVFVFPTYYECECFPLSILEAMAYGLPVVSTPEGAISEIVEDGVTGFLVKQKDSDELAKKLAVLAHDYGLRHRMGEAGRRKFIDRYTEERFIQQLSSILNACLK